MNHAPVIEDYAGVRNTEGRRRMQKESKNEIFNLSSLLHEHLAAYNPLTSLLYPLHDVLHRATTDTFVERAVVRGMGALPIAYRAEIKVQQGDNIRIFSLLLLHRRTGADTL